MSNPLTVLFRDDHLLIVHKPAGLLVHRSHIDKHETE
ncbi:MAG TPA: pseudouridylate synthase, partial [Marinobacter adhaerens]|nr:pseudouridylate synthase [Marinobacter adhaerens]